MAHIPYGYRIAGGKAEIDPEAKEKLDAFFASYLAGASIDKAAKEAGINRRHSVMAKMMQNPLYLGTDYYPAIVDRATFDAVADEMASRSVHHKPRGSNMVIRQVMTRFSLGSGRIDPALPAVDQAARMYDLITAVG